MTLPSVRTGKMLAIRASPYFRGLLKKKKNKTMVKHLRFDYMGAAMTLTAC